MLHGLLFMNRSGRQTRIYCVCGESFTSPNYPSAVNSFINHIQHWLLGMFAPEDT